LKAGKIFTFKETTHKKVKEIKITSEKPITVNIDGELYENIPFEAKIISNTLKIYR
jgi:diacylglycerol kinase family enzyme